MSVEALRAIERLHGALAWFATAALVATAWALARRRGQPRAAVIAGAAAMGLTAITTALGIALHDPYRARVRQRVFLDSAALGWLFERKQHLAFAAVLFALCAISTLGARALAGRRAGGGALAHDLERSAILAWSAAALCALAASIASVIVARRHGF